MDVKYIRKCLISQRRC